jgi:soluble lytic murein transglycosylase-like protein
MTIENQPENLSPSGRRLAGDRARYVRLRLSAQNQLMLLVVFAVAVTALFCLASNFYQGYKPAWTAGMVTYEEMFQEIAPKYGLDWRLLARVAYRESRFDPAAVGQQQERGLMQIMPVTWAEWSPQVGVSDPFDPYSSVLVGAAYLAFLRDYFGDMGYSEERWMLAAYNWGPDNVRQLLENGGGWEQVPILQPATDMPPGWEAVRATPVIRVNARP